LGSPTETPKQVVAPTVAPGEVILLGDPIPITIDGYLVGVLRIGDVDYCQIKIPTEKTAPNSFKCVPVERHLVRVPPMIRGMKV